MTLGLDLVYGFDWVGWICNFARNDRRIVPSRPPGKVDSARLAGYFIVIHSASLALARCPQHGSAKPTSKNVHSKLHALVFTVL